MYKDTTHSRFLLGVLPIEEAARKHRETYQTDFPTDLSFLGPILERVLTRDNIIEIMTRLEVEKYFRKLAASGRPTDLSGDMLDVLF